MWSLGIALRKPINVLVLLLEKGQPSKILWIFFIYNPPVQGRSQKILLGGAEL